MIPDLYTFASSFTEEVYSARSSRGLGHLPFTEETRVRFPYGLHNQDATCSELNAATGGNQFK
jgi:hypothetical protein